MLLVFYRRSRAVRLISDMLNFILTVPLAARPRSLSSLPIWFRTLRCTFAILAMSIRQINFRVRVVTVRTCLNGEAGVISRAILTFVVVVVVSKFLTLLRGRLGIISFVIFVVVTLVTKALTL